MTKVYVDLDVLLDGRAAVAKMLDPDALTKWGKAGKTAYTNIIPMDVLEQRTRTRSSKTRGRTGMRKPLSVKAFLLAGCGKLRMWLLTGRRTKGGIRYTEVHIGCEHMAVRICG